MNALTPVFAQQIAALRQLREADNAEKEAKRAAAATRRPVATVAGSSPIEKFNAAHRIADLLVRYGYEEAPNGQDWRSPMQESGSFATRVFVDDDGTEHWVSLSQSDAEAGLGVQSANGARFGDAFDLYVHFEHGGVRIAALAAWRDKLAKLEAERRGRSQQYIAANEEPGDAADSVPLAAVTSPLQELQHNFCLLALGGEVRIAVSREIAQVMSGERDEDINMYRMDAGRLLMLRLLTSLPVTSDPKRDIAEFLLSPNTTVYDAIAFSPLPTPSSTLNYWSGSPVVPVKGNWFVIQEFLLDVICEGDTDLYGYLLRFIAHMLQHPEDKPGIIITLLGGQGTGKGTFFELLRAIWSRTCLSVSDVEHVVGKYNAAIERNFVICMDEALFAGDRRGMDRLKSFVTEPIVTIEQKNQPRRSIRSNHRFFAASNHAHFAQVDADDRRFVFLRVSDARQGDFAYWKKVHAGIADPTVIAGFVHDLLGYDLSEFNVRDRPKTREHMDQKLRSLSGFDRYWYHVLQTGDFGEGASPDPSGTWSAPCFLSTENIMKAWTHYEKGQRQYATRQESEVHQAMRRLCPSADRRRRKGSVRPQKRGFRLPALPAARGDFERAMGGEVEWHDQEEAEE